MGSLSNLFMSCIYESADLSLSDVFKTLKISVEPDQLDFYKWIF